MIVLKKTTILIFFLLLSHIAIANDSSWLHVKEQNIINSDGTIFRIKGINLSNNVYGNWDEKKSPDLQNRGKDPLIRPLIQDKWVLGPDDFDNIRKLNVNTVRYCFNHELFDQKNPFKKTNLAKLKKDIAIFKSYGIYVILNLHLPVGLDVQSIKFEKHFSGDQREKSIFESSQYWRQTIDLWKFLVFEFKDEPAILGFELFNEPTIPSNKEGGRKKVMDSYNEIVNTLRKIDFRHIFILPENDTMEDDTEFQNIHYRDKQFIKIEDDNIAYAFHWYEPTSLTIPGVKKKIHGQIINFTALYKKYEWSIKNNVPIVVSEFGIASHQSLTIRTAWLKKTLLEFDRIGLGFLYWTYKQKDSPWNKGHFGLYSHYYEKNEHITSDGDFKDWLKKEPGFSEFKKRYLQYYQLNELSPFPRELIDILAASCE